MLVSIVIPCYNSEHTIGKVVELAIEEFEKLKDYECEFVLVNDYSRDGTWNAIHSLTYFLTASPLKPSCSER